MDIIVDLDRCPGYRVRVVRTPTACRFCGEEALEYAHTPDTALQSDTP